MKEYKEYLEEKKQKELAMAKVLEEILNSPVFQVSVPGKDDTWISEAGTPGYDQLRLGIEKRMNEAKKLQEESLNIPDFTDFRGNVDYGIEYLTESENFEVDRWAQICADEFDGNPMDEGFLGKLVGGVAGFLVGPTIGKIIANALGVNQGILYDMFTSRLVSAVLGSSIAKAFGGEYKN